MDKLRDAAPEVPEGARRRYLTILFSDLSDSTGLSDAMETEDYGGLLKGLGRIYHEGIVKHGGTVVQIQGDGLLAVFGYPKPGEDDGRRATEAALELHRRVRELAYAAPHTERRVLALHTGIHAGLILLEPGDLVHGLFELRGTATNVARRLSDAARSDEILVSEETLGAERHFFETGPRRLLPLRGRTDSIAVYPVLDRRTTVSTRYEARVRRGLVPFVGRRHELRMLESGLGEAMAGRQVSMTVVAPPGVGKTRLVEEFLRGVGRGCQIHRGYCESYLSAQPLQAFLQMLRGLCRLDHGMPPGLAADAVDRTLSAIDPALLKHRMQFQQALSVGAPEAGIAPAKGPTAEGAMAAFRDLFARLAAQTPQIMFIDDWQWADDATRRVLGAIEELESASMLVLIATREHKGGAPPRASSQILELAPFSAEESAETVRRLLPDSGPFRLAEIHRYSGGNPLFIEELCHSAAIGDRQERAPSRNAAAWLNSLIESRVARLPQAQAAVVRAASVVGNVIPAWLLERITGYGEDHALIQALAEQDLLFPGEAPGTLRFKHGIARDVIYEAVGLYERRAMHLRIAEALREHGAGVEEDRYEALAYHYGAAARWAEAARYAELAGDKAMTAAALDRAQSQYSAALAALEQLPPDGNLRERRNQLVQRYGLVCIFDPARNQLDVLKRAVQLAQAERDEAGVAIGQYWLGYINYGLGESRAAVDHCERSLRAARQIGHDALRVQIQATLGEARAAACDYERALALLDEAIALKEKHRTAGRPAVGSAYSLACKAAVLGDRGSFVEAHACFDQALEALRGGNKVVEGSVLCWRSAVCLWQGRWDDALRSASQAEAIAERVKSLYVFGMSRALGGYASWMLTRAPDALQTIIDATSWLEARDKRLFISLNYGWLADGMACSARWQTARHYAARALLRARQSDRLGQPMAYRALARVAAARKEGKPAAQYLALAMRSARAKDSRHDIAVNQLCEAELALADDRRARARELLGAAAAAFDAMAMEWHAAQAAALRAKL